MWPQDKLSILQAAATLTDNNAPNVADDGSPEWQVGSIAYEIALPYAIEQKNWKFQTKVEVLTPLPTPPSDPAFDTAYAKPLDLWHLIWVRMGGQAGANIPYQVLDNQIVLSRAGVSIGDNTVRAKYVYGPADTARETPTFVTALLAFVMSGYYRSLNYDSANADKQWAFGESLLQSAATRSDQEQGKRAMFVSRQVGARYVRRPLDRRFFNRG